MEEASVFENFELQLDQSAKDFLKEIAKWAYFLSILGFVAIGLMIVFAFFAGTVFTSMGNSVPAMGSSFGAIMGFFYFFIAALYFFPVYYLNKFATNAKKAFRDNDSEALSASFGYLKSHYKFIGIMTLSILVLYGLIFAFGIFGALLGR
ncbi:hypothetical protein [Flavobacterium sp. JAS]|uniref:hypothetical protein n=1 Tax=Flavobacterium sp. JAS TaxID=2897329 RepID=UPI001E657E33|nr:hypothetical protein [Flavobacterium sp. JAS]MCD0471129.1 hypothetical protein [Flavobacterium sp. JAS]